MKINTITTRETTVYEIADALAGATPEEFAAFFLRLSERLLKDHDKMMAFAEVMANEQGANRKNVLKELLRRIAYYEGKTAWETAAEKEDEEP